MDDPVVMEFISDRGARARFVTSVCASSLVLAASGLLKGYRATGHWQTPDLLTHMGTLASNERLVLDRNRITGGGMTAGLEFGLQLVSQLRNEAFARRVQLVPEYDPQPVFNSGSDGTAAADVIADVQRLLADGRSQSISAADRALARLGL